MRRRHWASMLRRSNVPAAALRRDVPPGVNSKMSFFSRDRAVKLVVSEASRRSLDVGARVSAMARQLGLTRQVLAVTGCDAAQLAALPRLPGLPAHSVAVPALPGLAARQARDGSVLSLPEVALADAACAAETARDARQLVSGALAKKA